MLHCGYMRILEIKMEATIADYIGVIWGIVENKMEATIVCYIAHIRG